MARQVIVGSRPVALAAKVPGGSARGHSHRCHLRRPPSLSSTFLRSLRSMAVTPLLRYYGRCDSDVHPLFSALPRQRGRLFCTPVSLIHAIDLPTILSPITCACSVSPRHVTCRWIGPRRHPSAGSSPSGNSGLRLQLAGSPHHSGRIEFLIVRTGRSPPAAPHPALRRRSCSRFQVTLTWRGLPPLRSIALSGAQAQANGLGLEDPPILAPTLKGRNRCSCMPQSLSHAYGIACDERYVWD